ncbi:hypothetical protein [Aurantiacibacter marinus]|uniref:Uncharacterized protein n=1 Tax=Aurantiacibacter marinus TaxID=874156 RepID=A0A0H0XQH5_9SPHN|nr:hypothetical protein [Aurantiacibacter marinus]KLI64271.1 hypothetical protein AAV99_01070 [Aurantiacibacter marinus]
MADQGHDPAKARWAMLQLIRAGGLLFILGGMVILSDAIAGPPILGIGLLLIGMFEFFFLPVLIARRWKSPPE